MLPINPHDCYKFTEELGSNVSNIYSVEKARPNRDILFKRISQKKWKSVVLFAAFCANLRYFAIFAQKFTGEIGLWRMWLNRGRFALDAGLNFTIIFVFYFRK